MGETGTARLFKHGRSQAVRLPKEFRMPGTQVRVRRIGRGVLLEPIDQAFDIKAWFASETSISTSRSCLMAASSLRCRPRVSLQ